MPSFYWAEGYKVIRGRGKPGNFSIAGDHKRILRTGRSVNGKNLCR